MPTCTQFMATKLWQPLGAEFDASWSLDSEGDAFEKMESGLNVTPVDYARFGLLFLHGGEWNGRRIVSRDWVRSATLGDLNPVIVTPPQTTQAASAPNPATTLSHPAIRTFIKDNLVALVKKHFAETNLIAGVATAGIAQGAMVADAMNLPFVYVRPEPKKHGMGKQVEGDYNEDEEENIFHARITLDENNNSNKARAKLFVCYWKKAPLCRNGLFLRSIPIKVSGPWPLYTFTSSGKVIILPASVLNKVSPSALGISNLPTLP